MSSIVQPAVNQLPPFFPVDVISWGEFEAVSHCDNCSLLASSSMLPNLVNV